MTPHGTVQVVLRPAILFGFFAPLGFLFAAFASAAGLQDPPLVPLIGGCLLAGMLLVGNVLEKLQGPRGRIVGAVAVVFVAPSLLFAGLSGLSNPILDTTWRCGTGDSVLFVLAVPTVSVVTVLGFVIASALFRRERRWLDTLLEWSSFVAVFATVALFTGALGRAVRYPDHRRYLETVPRVASLPPPTDPATVELHAGVPHVWYQQVTAGIAVRRDCQREACVVSLARTGDRFESRAKGLSVARDATLSLKRDDLHALWIVNDAMAFRDDLRLDPTRVSVSDVADRLSPPRTWIAGAAVGLLLAGLAARSRRRHRETESALREAMTGRAEAGGWITLDEGAGTVRVEGGADIDGPVVVMRKGRPHGSVYRGQGPVGPVSVLVGAKEEHLACARARIVASTAMMLAILSLAGAPLVAAAMRGLVF
jgi:hypothetical protein